MTTPSHPIARPAVAAGAIRNLAFQGGGVKGIAYVGGIEVLEERGLLAGVLRVAGTSAGAITAALLAVGATAGDLRRILTTTTFSAFKDRGHLITTVHRVRHDFGLYKGDFFLGWMRDHIAELTEKLTGTAQPDLSFAQLGALAAAQPGRFRELYTVATNLSRQRPEVFSAATTPAVSVALAVRMSMSIPLFFESVTFDGSIYVDGGLSWNYPIDLFAGVERLPITATPSLPRTGDIGTLGFSLGTAERILAARDDWQAPHVEITDLDDLARAMFRFMAYQSTRLHLDAAALARTVFVDDAGVATTEFDLSSEQMAILTQHGRDATCAFLDSLA